MRKTRSTGQAGVVKEVEASVAASLPPKCLEKGQTVRRGPGTCLGAGGGSSRASSTADV